MHSENEDIKAKLAAVLAMPCEVEQAAKVEVNYDEQRRERIERHIAEDFGREYTDKTLENFRDANGIIPAIKKAYDENRDIYMFGESRKGKTHITVGLYRIALEAGESIRFINSVDLDILISDYSNDNRNDDINDIVRCKRLIIDDIGVGKLTPERHSIYYKIINWRNVDGLQTIYTSNHPTKDLWKGLTEIDPFRLVKRMREDCHGVEVK
jgi:DNA replication protein DnaC